MIIGISPFFKAYGNNCEKCPREIKKYLTDPDGGDIIMTT
jgi:hypothetical protein